MAVVVWNGMDIIGLIIFGIVVLFILGTLLACRIACKIDDWKRYKEQKKKWKEKEIK